MGSFGLSQSAKRNNVFIGQYTQGPKYDEKWNRNFTHIGNVYTNIQIWGFSSRCYDTNRESSSWFGNVFTNGFHVQ